MIHGQLKTSMVSIPLFMSNHIFILVHSFYITNIIFVLILSAFIYLSISQIILTFSAMKIKPNTYVYINVVTKERISCGKNSKTFTCFIGFVCVLCKYFKFIMLKVLVQKWLENKFSLNRQIVYFSNQYHPR